MERWEAMYFEGRHAGFLGRVLEDGVLTTRTAFGGGTPESAMGRYLAESRVTLSPGGSVLGWTSFSFQDSASTQRVAVDRVRAGLDADAVPSHGEYLLLIDLVERHRAEETFLRVEESTAFTGRLDAQPASLRRAGRETVELPDGTVVEGERVELHADGVILAVHWVDSDGVLMSDWMGGAISVPERSTAEALAGMDEAMTAFAVRGFGS